MRFIFLDIDPIVGTIANAAGSETHYILHVCLLSFRVLDILIVISNNKLAGVETMKKEIKWK